MRKRERGFTLIELLIVLAILGILVGIVAMSVGNIRTVATKRGMQSEWETVNTAVESYCSLDASTPSDYPEAIGGISTGAVTSASQITATNPTIGNYLDRTTKYYYALTGAGTTSQELCVLDADVGSASWQFCTGDSSAATPVPTP